jgi:hypothetical protein
MPTTARLFTLLNEIIVLLLGGLLILLASTRALALPSRPVLLVALGAFFIFWGGRAWARPAPNAGQFEAAVRAGSLAIVGILLVAIPLLSLGHASLLLEVAGAVLVVRGLVGATMFLSAAKGPAS